MIDIQTEQTEKREKLLDISEQLFIYATEECSYHNDDTVDNLNDVVNAYVEDYGKDELVIAAIHKILNNGFAQHYHQSEAQGLVSELQHLIDRVTAYLKAWH